LYPVFKLSLTILFPVRFSKGPLSWTILSWMFSHFMYKTV
jgi:hypothetical protein